MSTVNVLSAQSLNWFFAGKHAQYCLTQSNFRQICFPTSGPALIYAIKQVTRHAAEICPGTSRKFNTEVSSKSHSCYAPRTISPPRRYLTVLSKQNNYLGRDFSRWDSRNVLWNIDGAPKRQNGGKGKCVESLSKFSSRVVHLDYSQYVLFRFYFSLYLGLFFPSS